MSKQPVIAVMRPLPREALAALQARGRVAGADLAQPADRATAAVLLEEADIAFVTALDRLGRDALQCARRLRLVVSVGAGLNHIDIDFCAEQGIEVRNTPHAPAEATADMAFALMLATARRVAEGDRFVRTGEWSRGASMPLGLNVHGRTLGIIGFGRIGQAVARRAAGFGMPILYTARTPKEDAGIDARHIDLDTLLKESDFIVVQTPLTSETQHLIDARALALMKPDAILVNTARGGVVDDLALAEALHAGRIAGAGLDVFENEPNVCPALLSAPNTVFAPHAGSATEAARMSMFAEALATLDDALKR